MKNILLLSFGNIHNETFLATLVHDYQVDPACLFVVFIDRPEGRAIDPLPGGIEELSWQEACTLNGADISALFLQSLYPANAKALQDFVAATGVGYDRVHILITDNEVDLWNAHVEKHGSLEIGATPGIDAAVCAVMGKVDRYICMDRPYGDLIAEIRGRPVITPDTFPQRRLLPDPVAYAAFTGRVRRDIEALQRRARNRNILFLTKPMSYRRWRVYMRDLMRFALTGRCRGTVNVWLWERRKRWSFLEMLEYGVLVAAIPALSRLLRRFGRPDIRIRTLPALTREEYMLLLLRCHAVIGQHRSGAGALTEALRWNRLVMMPEGLYNDVTFRQEYGFPILHRSRNSIAEIVKALENTSPQEEESAQFRTVFSDSYQKFWAMYGSILRKKPDA